MLYNFIEKNYVVDCHRRTFDESVKFCKSVGHTIASFHSEEDINEAKEGLADMDYCWPDYGAYIGATSDGNGNWKWMDNTDWWKYNENDGLVGTYETKIIWKADRKWHDSGTGQLKTGVICQKGMLIFIVFDIHLFSI